MKQLVITLLALAFITSFAQEQKQQNFSIELSAGQFFSEYRYFKNYNGLENIGLGISKEIPYNFGINLTQTYSRMYNENTNNRGIVLNSTLNIFYTLFKQKRISIRLYAGGGLIQIHTKSLYESYPFENHIYGLSFRGNLAVRYKLSDKLYLNINSDFLYNKLTVNDENAILNDDYYKKTIFNSLNVGFNYYF